MKFTILSTIFFAAFCGLCIFIYDVNQEKNLIMKDYNKQFSDTPKYFKDYQIRHKKMFK